MDTIPCYTSPSFLSSKIAFHFIAYNFELCVIEACFKQYFASFHYLKCPPMSGGHLSPQRELGKKQRLGRRHNAEIPPGQQRPGDEGSMEILVVVYPPTKS